MKKKQAKGTLPSESYYTKKDLVERRGLYLAIRSHPEAFSHIKKNFRGGKNLEKWIKIAEKLAKENKGILPCDLWLNKNRYSGLSTFIRNHPESFAHIKKDYKGGKTLNEWIKEAEKLAKDNKGILPCYFWLMKNRYSGLNNFIKKYPESFSHIKQEKKRGNSLEEWIKEAEKLTKDNKGILPCHSWLNKNKYSGLRSSIRNYPESFSHLKQENIRRKNLEKWIKIAEKLAKDNKGILPYHSWLNKNKYSGLSSAIKKYPDYFSHLKQDFKGGKNLEKWIKIAEKLVRDNKGILPSVSWLNKNRYSGLSSAIKKYPDYFSHIKQEKKIRNLEEWIKEAEKLAKDNKGILPSVYWLNKNQYSGLYYSIRNYPESFSHIKQEKKGNSLEEWIKEAEKLTKDNKGILPCHSWLDKNKYSGLRSSIRNYPESFSHLKQEYRGQIKFIGQ